MALPLKVRGVEHLRDVKARAIRQHGLERISKRDRDHIVGAVEELEAYIIAMDESSGEEEF